MSTLHQRIIYAGIGCWHLAAKGPGQRLRERRGWQLLKQAMHTVQPDTRPEYAREVAFSVAASGMALQAHENHLHLQIEQELAVPPDMLLVQIRSTPKITLTLNSPGGEGPAVDAYLDAMRNKEVEVRIRHAASAAGLLGALAPGRRLIHPDGTIMLHGAAVCCYGPPALLREAADKLEVSLKKSALALSRRTGRPLAETTSWLERDDHVFTARQAVDAGLADVVETF